MKKPTPAKTQSLAIKLCEASPEGPHPCPISIGDDKIAAFEKASKTNVGIVPVVACAQRLAFGPEAEELNELQARLMDDFQNKFLSAWSTIPHSVRGIAQKFDDFALVVKDGTEGDKKTKIFAKRLALLRTAPASMNKEVDTSLSALQDYLKNNMSTVTSQEGDLVLKTSHFKDALTGDLIRVKIPDPERIVRMANETLKIEGLNYKVRLKGESNEWTLCSMTAAFKDESCHLTAVNFRRGRDSCGSFAVLGSSLQLGPAWVLATSSSHFKVEATDVFSPSAAVLQKSDTVIRSWNVPEDFFPEYLAGDYQTLLLGTVIKSDAGKRLAALHLEVRDNGRAFFIEAPKNVRDLIKISGRSVQNIKGPDGSSYQFRLPRRCH